MTTEQLAELESHVCGFCAGDVIEEVSQCCGAPLSFVDASGKVGFCGMCKDWCMVERYCGDCGEDK